jgi:antitoxin ParD1/3/4
MVRQSITLTKQNDEWLKNQVAEEKFNNKSEAVNYLIKQARDREDYNKFIQMKIDRGIKSGFSTKTKEELLIEIKKKYKLI